MQDKTNKETVILSKEDVILSGSEESLTTPQTNSGGIYERFFKRPMDFILALCAIIVLLPILLIVALIVRIKLGSPVIFKQQRPGLNEKIFTLYKFRTMTDEKDEKGELLFDSERLTKFGRMLRSTSLDELPELFNILKGDMSVIGPRPQLIKDMVFMTSEQRKRHNVMPGLSGWAQINGRNDMTWERKLELDLEYIAKITFFGDVKIILITLLKAFKREGISYEGMDTAEDFGDYLLRTGKMSKGHYESRQAKAKELLEHRRQVMDWKYYNHAMIPTTAPHMMPDVTPIKDGSIWNSGRGGRPYLVRWTTEFDCGYETEWWYCIKNTPLDIAKLNSKRRYEINKDKKNYNVKVIDPVEYVEDIITIQRLAWANYPAAYKPKSNPESLRTGIGSWRSYCVFGAFSVELNQLSGYALINDHGNWANFAVLKVIPECERLAINAAMVAAICEHYNDKFGDGFYISDGERNIVHITAFQEYLEKYFDFRKAYCKLNLLYKKPLGLCVKVLMPFRKVIKKLDDKPLFSKVSAILLMESISQGQKQEDEYE